MNAFVRFLKRMELLLLRKRFSRELEEEMTFHREQVENELRSDGMEPEAAQHAARRQFGNQTRLNEQSHEIVGFGFEQVLQDLRFAVRQLCKNPGFACTAILILALGIGANTAIFSAVNPILFKPLPYPEAGRVMMLWEKQDGNGRRYPSFGNFHGLQERSHSFEAMAVMKPWQPAMIGVGQPERFEGQRVSAGYFRTLGLSPELGRDFQASDDQFHGPNVVILSDRLWHRRFNGDPSIVGRQVTFDDSLYTVIGVMPGSFENVLAPAADLWAPLQYDTALIPGGREWGHHLRMVGRLRPGVSREQAISELGSILPGLARSFANGYDSTGGAPDGMNVTPLQSDIARDIRPALLAVLDAVLLVLFIACVNVTNLLLARGAQRQSEFAMRMALGARRARIVQQLVTESLLLAFLGAAFGVVVAEVGVRVLVALSPPGLPRVNAIQLDGTVFAVALVVTTVIGIVVGLVPALQSSRSDLHIGLQQGSQRVASARHWMRRALVVAEVALALVLLVSAGLLLRSMQRLFAVDPGFDPSHLLTMQVQEYGHRFDNDTARYQFFSQALDAVRQVPGVASAAFTNQLPLSGDSEVYGVEFEKDNKRSGEAGFRYAVTSDYFQTMRIPLRRGRLLDENDRADTPHVALISESFTKRKFPGQDPIGQRIRVGPDAGRADRPWVSIVGVVADVKQQSLSVSDDDAFYVPDTQWGWADNVRSLVVRTHGDAAIVAPVVRDAIWSVDKDQPVVRVATMSALVAASEAQRHFALILFETFALTGLVLAATGVYGVVSGGVIERMREMGIRAALGASRADLLTMMVRQGMALTGLGIAIGLIGAVVASRAIVTLLFGVSQLDAVTYTGVIVLLLVVSAIACLAPAWRAARVDPSIILRAE
jgi:putative ABC transport system permease protein